ncbi:MAG: rRNA maturation RNase YbeY [Deltaproteobacteria bacterium]|nr:rRNA maturation RNase YbeY [Deltaproteobacteria bacterium]
MKIEKKKVCDVAGAILAAVGCTSVELSILFMDDEDIRELNREYRKKNRPTDVLSFPMREGEFGDLNPDLLGDVVISLDTAKRQAEERGETLEEEITLLLIHGILHLLGFDHEKNTAEARRMQAKEKELAGLLKP